MFLPLNLILLYSEHGLILVNYDRSFILWLQEYEPIYLANYQMRQFNSQEPQGQRGELILFGSAP